MQITSASANKILKQLNEEYRFLLDQDMQQRVYPEIEGVAPIIPDYDITDATKQLIAITDKISRLKHALNIFNTTTMLPGHDYTIDEALVRMTFLSYQKSRLNAMRSIPEKRMISGRNSRNNQVEYELANFDPKEAENLYNIISEELSELQLSLDTVNSTEKFDIEL